MARTNKQISFDDALHNLRSAGFDVQSAADRFVVSQHGCAITLLRAADGSVACAGHACCIVAGEHATLVDHGYQKFFRTSRGEFPATADRLRALHTFTEELHAAAGTPSLYNESLGTVSDSYLYDRLKGRETPQPSNGALNDRH
jgi:hypothetical protein